MRIFLVLHPSGNRALPKSLTWYRNLYEPLLDLSHEVHLIRLDVLESEWGLKFRSETFKDKFSVFLAEQFEKENRKNKFDLFFCYLTDLDIDPGVINAIKEKDIMEI